VLRYAGDVYTELILRFAKSINSNATTLFKAKLSPWATGAGKKANGTTNGHQEEEEEIDTEPKKMEWNLTPELRTGIRFAETRLSDLICQNDVVALEFQNYGKSFITRHGFSPDACMSVILIKLSTMAYRLCQVVQMAYQAAYYSLYGRIECTYEPAMTKSFLHGRTEAIRYFTCCFSATTTSADCQQIGATRVCTICPDVLLSGSI
jgi:carnitine O-acetyltransferase